MRLIADIMKRIKQVSALLLLLANLGNGLAGTNEVQITDVAFTAVCDGAEQRYMEILPADFDPAKKHDLVIGLHGHGSDRKQFATAVFAEANAFRAFAAKYGMIAITPDYRAKTSWMGPKAEADMVQIINDLKKNTKSTGCLWWVLPWAGRRPPLLPPCTRNW